MTIRLGWVDERVRVTLPPPGSKSGYIQSDYLLLNRNPIEHLWVPDVYFVRWVILGRAVTWRRCFVNNIF